METSSDQLERLTGLLTGEVAHDRENERGHALRNPVEHGEGLEREPAEIALLGLDAQVTGMSSWLGLSFTDRPIRTVRDALTADASRARAFSLGLLLGGVYLTPSHPGFTSAAHTEADVEHVLEASEQVLTQIKQGGSER